MQIAIRNDILSKLQLLIRSSVNRSTGISTLKMKNVHVNKFTQYDKKDNVAIKRKSMCIVLKIEYNENMCKTCRSLKIRSMQNILPREDDNTISGYWGVVAICVTHPPCPWRVPLSVICSAIVFLFLMKIQL